MIESAKMREVTGKVRRTILAITLDQSNCRPSVLHRNFRSRTEAEMDLHIFPLDAPIPS